MAAQNDLQMISWNRKEKIIYLILKSHIFVISSWRTCVAESKEFQNIYGISIQNF